MKQYLLILLATLFVIRGTTQTVNITFHVNMNGVAVDPSGVFIAGGSGFDSPGDNPMFDPDGDGVYSITLSRPENFSSHYILLNGNCSDYSCKENIAGQTCSDPLNFFDRFISVGTNDTVVSTCFGFCTEDTACSAVQFVDITFNVDMSNETVDPSGVYVAGGGAFGQPGDFEMTDPDGDEIYSITISKPANLAANYTFTNGADFANKEDIAGQDCADPDNFNDRFIEVGTNDTAICTVFGQCVFDDNCDVTSIGRRMADQNWFSVHPNQTSSQVMLRFETAAPGRRTIDVCSYSGQQLISETMSGHATEHRLSLQGLSPSIYFIRVSQDGKTGIEKVQVIE